ILPDSAGELEYVSQQEALLRSAAIVRKLPQVPTLPAAERGLDLQQQPLRSRTNVEVHLRLRPTAGTLAIPAGDDPLLLELPEHQEHLSLEPSFDLTTGLFHRQDPGKRSGRREVISHAVPQRV